MKDKKSFWGGVAVGVVGTILLLFVLAIGHEKNDDFVGATMFDQPGEVINEQSFKVLQVVNENSALVYGKKNARDKYYSGTLYMIRSNEQEYYYDEEIIHVPSDKIIRQVGIYQYTNKLNTKKTVPIIKIMDR